MTRVAVSAAANRDVYAREALRQVPRLLSNQDRNPASPTYGCFHRDYWLDKTSDFPDAVRQFAVHALALVYRHDFPGNLYRDRAKIRDWTIAGLDFWQSIQHRDGSFDEFYPFERGWVGPTAFTTFTSVEAYDLLRGEMPPDVEARVRAAIRRAAHFIAAGESEDDHLANHHAMACLAVWRAREVLGDSELEAGFGRLWRGFLDYHRAEGWSREYDGVDPGYLSATISFLAKIAGRCPAPELPRVLEESVEFASYFVYPNGFYAGSLGSRNTLHFYPHGFERLAPRSPLAAAVAGTMRTALAEGKLVPPSVISDRYVAYRVPEFLQAYLDSPATGDEEREGPPPNADPAHRVPYERPAFTRYFEDARIYVHSDDRHYLIANLAKGGVLKLFDRIEGTLLINDGGLLGRLENGRVATSQWVDPEYRCEADDSGFRIAGHVQLVPSNKLFTPAKLILFRAALLALGWSPRLCHFLKASIRRSLILGRRPLPLRFERRLEWRGEGENGPAGFDLVDQLVPDGPIELTALTVGGEFFVRYVPQSRYFQSQELDIEALDGSAALGPLARGEAVTLRRSWRRDGDGVLTAVDGTVGGPAGETP